MDLTEQKRPVLQKQAAHVDCLSTAQLWIEIIRTRKWGKNVS